MLESQSNLLGVSRSRILWHTGMQLWLRIDASMPPLQSVILCRLYSILAEWIKVCINHGPGMTLTFLRQGQLRSPMHLNGKNRKISFNGRKVARNEQMDRKFMFMKLFWAQGVICICPGAIYIYMTIIFKHLLL